MARAVCSVCRRPERVCVCEAMSQHTSAVEVIIWQDPTEAKHPLSTAPLLHASLTNSRLLVGDQLSCEQVFNTPNAGDECAVLYPFTHKDALTGTPVQRINTLLVLDGTWRKVRRLVHLNPWLLTLNHITLTPTDTSRYRVRKSPRADGLCTLEACAYALNAIDPTQDYTPMMAVVDRLADVQDAFVHS